MNTAASLGSFYQLGVQDPAIGPSVDAEDDVSVTARWEEDDPWEIGRKRSNRGTDWDDEDWEEEDDEDDWDDDDWDDDDE